MLKVYKGYGKSLGAIELSSEEPREWGSSGVQRRLENSNWEYRVTESREWEYSGVQRSMRIETVGNSYRKLVVKEELKVSL
jgi:hypothetical protein